MAMKTSRTFLPILLLAVAALGLSSGNVFAETEQGEKIDLRILYSGHPGSTREKDFVVFLRKHFRAVETGDLAKFNPNQAKGFDVIILDYDGDGFKAPRVHFPSGYSRPTVTVGVVGAFICGSHRLKTGYL